MKNKIFNQTNCKEIPIEMGKLWKKIDNFVKNKIGDNVSDIVFSRIQIQISEPVQHQMRLEYYK